MGSKKGYDRMDRIGDSIGRAIAKLLREDFKDPRIQWVTIASVEVSRDLAHARVYVTVLEDAKVEETLEILNKASGFFRTHLAKMMGLRHVPKPYFIFDESTRRGARIVSLLDKAAPAPEQPDVNNEPDTDPNTDQNNEPKG